MENDTLNKVESLKTRSDAVEYNTTFDLSLSKICSCFNLLLGIAKEQQELLVILNKFKDLVKEEICDLEEDCICCDYNHNFLWQLEIDGYREKGYRSSISNQGCRIVCNCGGHDNAGGAQSGRLDQEGNLSHTYKPVCGPECNSICSCNLDDPGSSSKTLDK